MMIFFSFVLLIFTILIFDIFDNINVENVSSQGLVIRDYLGLNTYEFKNLTGKNVTVAIIDSGISKHNDIDESRIVMFKDFVNNEIYTYDDYGHGTFVAGIIASNGKLKGIAPNVNLAILKVIDEDGHAKTENLLSALIWLEKNHSLFNIKVINISMGILQYEQSEISDKLNDLVGKGIVIISSSGNGGPVKASITYPGTNPLLLTVGYVNNNHTYKLNDDVIALSSGRGDPNNDNCKPDIVTLGIDIKSLDFLDDKGYITATGSSYSAAVATGVASLLFEKYENMPEISIERVMKKNTTKLNDFDGCSQGSGELYFK